MEEDDPSATDAPPRRLVDRSVALAATAFERLVEVPDAKTDVVNPGPPFRDELCDRAVRGLGFEQFDIDVAEMNGNNFGPIGCFRR